MPDYSFLVCLESIESEEFLQFASEYVRSNFHG